MITPRAGTGAALEFVDVALRDAGTNCTHDYDAALLQLRTVGAAARATARR